jgi:hypothetical protein
MKGFERFKQKLQDAVDDRFGILFANSTAQNSGPHNRVSDDGSAVYHSLEELTSGHVMKDREATVMDRNRLCLRLASMV